MALRKIYGNRLATEIFWNYTQKYYKIEKYILPYQYIPDKKKKEYFAIIFRLSELCTVCRRVN